MLGVPNERFYPFVSLAPLEAEFLASTARQRAAVGLPLEGPMPQIQLLAISGGGEDGAFGAGLLCGWSETGTRPLFEVVTGVSTGALTAPFAYLGSRYDAPLRSVYTQLSPERVLRTRFLPSALFDDALTDNAPLFATISQYMTPEMMADIAATYARGRLLLIATTNLDEQQPVIWNIGAIAGSGHPKALDTIRRVLLASSAIPGAFPPTMFDVTVQGQPYQEMHVDGGAFAQAFLYPPSLMRQRQEKIRRGQKVDPAAAYIIRNGRLDPQYSATNRRTLTIVGRAVNTMIAVSGYNDVQAMYDLCQDDKLDFNLAYIGTDFTREITEPFEPAYMRTLFDFSYDRAKSGYEWVHKPPRI